MKSTVISLLLIFLSGCTRAPLSVFTEYISIESMPSYRVGTPDPNLYFPDFGEKLHITWRTPPNSCLEDLEIRLFLRYGNGEDLKLTFPLFKKNGIIIFPLLNEDYWEKKGIFTYKIELFSGDVLLDTWLHQLYAERIIIN